MKRCSKDRLSTFFNDPYLEPYLDIIRSRLGRAVTIEHRLTGGKQSIADFASGHEFFGLHYKNGYWIFREWAPNAEAVFLIGPFSDWKPLKPFALKRLDDYGRWEIVLPCRTLKHGDLYRLHVQWHGGEGERIPAWTRRVVQDEQTKIFSAQVWAPQQPYKWRVKNWQRTHRFPLIYEAHLGMSQEKEGIGTFVEFRDNILPRIIQAGYNTVQLMAIAEHPYYGSFGYQVSNFFAVSSRFGTPDEFKSLVDTAHQMGLAVIIDLVHSHAVNNEVEGLSRFDGTSYQYFHDGERGRHSLWDSRCFDYGKSAVLHFLLSNCRFWLDEYHVDGFRFDGITSMLYIHHGLSKVFLSYDDYFNESVDEDALVYLTLANKVIHTVRPDAITIAEDVSGMPGLAAPIKNGGCGFDYRLAMGVPDCWFKLVNDIPDEKWNIGWLWHELTNRRKEEHVISYVECHDQALVGGKTLMFELVDADMYHFMRVSDNNLAVERGIALHKMARLVTLASAGHGYLNFIGNEFGHPEWIDFPRAGNNWSYHYARRQWRLRDDPNLKYHFLADFDSAIIRLLTQKGVLEKYQPRLVLVDDDAKQLVFTRGNLLFLFNFHPSNSVTDYPIEVPGKLYVHLLDTDERRFGGQGRIVKGQCFTHIVAHKGKASVYCIRIYLPCRTAMILERITPHLPKDG